MDDKIKLDAIVPPLLKWYDLNARILPWRADTEPYRVWVSEIMLQQTQVQTVKPYFDRFIRKLPHLQSLADAGEEQLLKLWEGLGYYNRVRNLQKAARIIMDQYGGSFPDSYEAILSLPGVGAYTAGAVASICFGEPVPAVDGNVLRVIARLTGCAEDIADPKTKNQMTESLRDIYPAGRSGDFTQSLMELGATVCLPQGSPKCAVCPLCFLCTAYRTGAQAALPVKSKKKPRKKERRTVLLLRFDDKIAVRRRPAGGLLGGLWEFPNVEGALTGAEAASLLAHWGLSAVSITKGPDAKHIFTHIEWTMTSYVVVCGGLTDHFLWVTKETLANDMALPSAFQKFQQAIFGDFSD